MSVASALSSMRSRRADRQASTRTPARLLGTVSYGIYLLHPFVIPVMGKAEHQSASPAGARAPRIGPVLRRVFIPTLVAAVSWRFFEKPINSLKSHFPYIPLPNRELTTEGHKPMRAELLQIEKLKNSASLSSRASRKPEQQVASGGVLRAVSQPILFFELLILASFHAHFVISARAVVRLFVTRSILL